MRAACADYWVPPRGCAGFGALWVGAGCGVRGSGGAGCGCRVAAGRWGLVAQFLAPLKTAGSAVRPRRSHRGHAAHCTQPQPPVFQGARGTARPAPTGAHPPDEPPFSGARGTARQAPTSAHPPDQPPLSGARGTARQAPTAPHPPGDLPAPQKAPRGAPKAVPGASPPGGPSASGPPPTAAPAHPCSDGVPGRRAARGCGPRPPPGATPDDPAGLPVEDRVGRTPESPATTGSPVADASR